MTNIITDYKLAAQYIKDGNLVAFPTETVYGLGANIDNNTSLQKIFTTKGRPQTNPLIVHTYSIVNALNLFKFSNNDLFIKDIIYIIAKNFWPGPLTIIYKANDNISDLITANTGYIGVRIPNHPIALKLLEETNIPIAAPSANKSGHISPTDCKHVFQDFENDNIYILDGGDIRQFNNGIGIESTIIKINLTNIEILRTGGTSINSLEDIFKQNNIKMKIILKEKQSNLETDEISPGQSITHYAPKDIETFIIKTQSKINDSFFKLEDYNKIGILDFGNMIGNYKNKIKCYMDLSPEQNIDIAMLNYYNYLRLIEQSPITKLFIIQPGNSNSNYYGLYDRMFRSASGKIIEV